MQFNYKPSKPTTNKRELFARAVGRKSQRRLPAIHKPNTPFYKASLTENKIHQWLEYVQLIKIRYAEGWNPLCTIKQYKINNAPYTVPQLVNPKSTAPQKALPPNPKYPIKT